MTHDNKAKGKKQYERRTGLVTLVCLQIILIFFQIFQNQLKFLNLSNFNGEVKALVNEDLAFLSSLGNTSQLHK